MSECREYVRSLINNLSLLSKRILILTEQQSHNMCRHLQNLQNRGFILNEYHMKQLINGTDQLNDDPDFKALKQLIKRINQLQYN
jgi:hypothetical protein